MASLRLALRLSREASEAPAPAPQDEPPPARPKKKKPSKRKPKPAAARPKARSRKPPATAVGGGTLEKLPWELLGAVAKFLSVEAAARWRGCGRSSAAGVGALWGEDRPELCAGELSASVTRIACTSAEEEEALWAHPHNTLCQVCGNGGRVVACAYCNLVWHAQCLAEAAAAGEKWRCPECVADQTAPVIGATSAFVRRRGDGLELVVGGGYHFSSFTPNGSRYVASLKESAAAWRRTPHEDAPPAGFSASDALAADDGTIRCFARYGNGERTEGPAWDAVDAPPQVAAAGAATVYDALWTLDEDGWRRRPLAGPRPTLRADASLAQIRIRGREVLVVFGGFAPDLRRPLGGLHALDVASGAWSTLEPDDLAPKPRAKPVRVAAPPPPPPPPPPPAQNTRGRAEPARGARTPTEAIFGEPDSDADSEVEFDADAAPELPPAADQARLAALGLRGATRPAERWEPEVAPRRKRGPRRKRARAAPTAPSPRAGHSCTRVGGELVVLCGLGRVEGQSGLPRSDYLDEAWFLSFDGATGAPRWRLPRVQGRPPGGRAGHAAAAVGPHVVVFGGVNAKQFLGDLHVLHAPARVWSAPRLAGPAVAPRMRPALVAARADADDSTTPTLYVFGGTRAWGAAAAVATATQRHDGDLFAVVLAPAPVAEMF